MDEFEEESEFAVHLTPEGKLNFLWITTDGYAKPVNPDLTDFKIKFKTDLTPEELLLELLVTEGERSSENPNAINNLIYMRDDFKNVAYDAEGNVTPIKMTVAPSVINKLSMQNKEVLFAPNPFDKYMRLMISPDILSNSKITIYNQLGTIVLSERIPETGAMYIQAKDSWTKGIYYYTIETSDTIHTGKLVKL